MVGHLRQRVRVVWNWCTWLLLVLLLFMQVLAVMWPAIVTNVHVVFGQDPSLGKYMIPGANDDPFTDRSIVCQRHSSQYVPVQLSQALVKQRTRPASIGNLTTNGIDAYRVIPRQSMTLDAVKLAAYTPACGVVTEKLSRIIDVCILMGYTNLTKDVLRVVDGTDGDRVTILPDTLPVLLLPYWDYSPVMRLAIPSADGSACVFRLSFNSVTSSGRDLSTMLSVTPRSYKEATTAKWLGVPSGGVWRNGWFEVPSDGSRWYSDVISADPTRSDEAPWYDFDLASDSDWMQPQDCTPANVTCENGLRQSFWGPSITISVSTSRVTSVAISNGSRFGLFIFEGWGTHFIKSVYSLEKFVSNVTLAGLSFQWLVAMIALRKTNGTIGVGSLANALSFKMLPLLLLPRLKSTLEGFWTAGCRFEGDQMALSESWSVIYPAIGEFVLVYFSLLNTVAKLLRRRVSDALFGPTLLFFALLHYSREDIASSKLFGFDGRVTTVVSRTEVDDGSLVNFFTTNLALRVNGDIVILYGMKIAALVVNLLPLLIGSRRVEDSVLGRHTSGVTPVDEFEERRAHSLEKALAMLFGSNGGLGLSPIYSRHPHASATTTVVVPYELIRAGYIVIGSASESVDVEPCKSPQLPSSMVMVSINDWCWLLVAAPIASCVDQSLMPRVLVYRVSVDAACDPKAETPTSSLVMVVDPAPRICRFGDLHFQRLQVTRVSAWSTH